GKQRFRQTQPYQGRKQSKRLSSNFALVRKRRLRDAVLSRLPPIPPVNRLSTAIGALGSSPDIGAVDHEFWDSGSAAGSIQDRGPERRQEFQLRSRPETAGGR